MLHIKPITEQDADEKVRLLYENIKKTFTVDTVPLLFQYLANFPDFLAYIWEKSALNLKTDVFENLADHLLSSATESTQAIYNESRITKEFIATISPHEKKYLLQTAQSVMRINAKLLVFTIAIRENIKGVFIGQKLLEGAFDRYKKAYASEEVFDQGPAYTPRLPKPVHEENIATTSSFLAPLFSSELATSSLPTFFAHIDAEVKELVKTEKYLEKRVLLEQEAIQASYRLPYPIGASYQEILQLAGNKPYFHELLPLLVDTFPTAYPRMLFTTTIMFQLLISA